MRSRLLAAILITGLASQCLPQPRSIKSKPPVFYLHLNQPVDPDFTSISYLVKGEKAGAGYGRESSGPDLKMTADQDIPIGLTLPQNEQRATALKAVVFCRGYRLAFVNVPSLGRVPSKRTVVDLVPLRSVALDGRVVLPEGENPADLRVEVHYDITLLAMYYFEQMEGISSGDGMKVAATTLAADGSFKTTVPDFANDPALKSYGRLHFGIRSLKPQQGVSESPEIRPPGGIPIASSYAEPISLELRWLKWDSKKLIFR